MRTHMWAIVLRCGLLLPLLFSFQLTSAAAAEASPDLAALVIRPSDRPRQAAEFTDEHFASWKDTYIPAGTAIRRANPDLTYIQHLRANRYVVIVTLMSFSADREAERGMDAYVGTMEDWLGDDASELDLAGVDTAVTYVHGLDDREMQFDTSVFRWNAMVAVMQVQHRADVEAVPIQDIAGLQRDRLDDGELTGISDLVSQALRLRVEGWNTVDSSYWGIEGEAIRRSTEFTPPEAFERRQDDMYSTGMVDIYRSQHVVYGNWDSSIDRYSGPTALLYVDIIAFEPEIGAWLREEIREANADFPEVAVPITGYDSYGVYASAERTGTRAQYNAFIWLDENTVVVFRHIVDVEGAAELGVHLELDMDATNDLIQRQLACFEGTRSCDTAVRSPYTYGEES